MWGEATRRDATESKSAMCNSVSMEQEEGTGDCDDLLIHGQRWVGGSWIGSIMKLI